MIRSFAWAALLLALAGPAVADGVQIEGAWVRAVPPVSPAVAAYFTLVNDTDKSLTLTGGKADFAGMGMLHSMHSDKAGMGGMGNMGSMHQLKSVTIKPGESTAFLPGQRHLMLMKLKSVPEAGQTVTICLTFRDHADVCAPFPVRRNAP